MVLRRIDAASVPSNSFHGKSVMLRLSVFTCLAVSTAIALSSSIASAQDKVFSGPQVGEKLTPFKVRGVYDQDAGKEMDFVSQADGKAIVLVFVHDLNRQSISFTRVLTQYTRERAKHALTTGIVWLDDDMTAAESTLNRIRHGLAESVPVGISVDGREGPGNYGLNRKVMVTILVGKDNVVTANYALVQPSLQTDLRPIVEHISKLIGTPTPKLEDLIGSNDSMQEQLRPLLRPVIQLEATPDQVDKAAAALVEFIEKDAAAKKELGLIASRIVNSQRLESYGTARAQEFLAKWAKEYGPSPQTPNPK